MHDYIQEMVHNEDFEDDSEDEKPVNMVIDDDEPSPWYVSPERVGF